MRDWRTHGDLLRRSADSESLLGAKRTSRAADLCQRRCGDRREPAAVAKGALDFRARRLAMKDRVRQTFGETSQPLSSDRTGVPLALRDGVKTRTGRTKRRASACPCDVRQASETLNPPNASRFPSLLGVCWPVFAAFLQSARLPSGRLAPRRTSAKARSQRPASRLSRPFRNDFTAFRQAIGCGRTSITA
jgi:hypothetical protein